MKNEYITTNDVILPMTCIKINCLQLKYFVIALSGKLKLETQGKPPGV